MKTPLDPARRTSTAVLARRLCTLLLAAAGCVAAADRAPQLTPEQARAYSRDAVLGHAGPAGREQPDPWQPLDDALVRGPLPAADYSVDQQTRPDGARRFASVQAAVNQAVVDAAREGRTRRRVIAIAPGRYEALVYVPADAPPLTLLGTGQAPQDVLIVAALDASVSGSDYQRQFGAQFADAPASIRAMHEGLVGRATLSTFGTPTVWVRAAGFQARGLTIANAFRRSASAACVEDCNAPAASAAAPPVPHQAVALALEGADRSQLEQVRLLGLQDTLYLKAQADGSTARSYLRQVYIEGDVDFIFGNATAYFEDSEIRSLSGRPYSYVGAPNTSVKSRHGLVFEHCRFSNDGSAQAEAQALAGGFHLARQWFQNQRCTPFGSVAVAGYSCTLGSTSAYTAPRGTITQTVLETVGKMVVLNSHIGRHIRAAQPWSDWNQDGKLSFRPAQFDSDDYWANLRAIGIDPLLQFGYPQQPRPAEVFLAEFRNHYEGGSGAASAAPGKP